MILNFFFKSAQLKKVPLCPFNEVCWSSISSSVSSTHNILWIFPFDIADIVYYVVKEDFFVVICSVHSVDWSLDVLALLPLACYLANFPLAAVVPITC